MTVILAENTSTSSENVALLLHTANQFIMEELEESFERNSGRFAIVPKRQFPHALLTDMNAFYQYFVPSMVAAATPVICDSVYTDVNLPRLACPTAIAAQCAMGSLMFIAARTRNT